VKFFTKSLSDCKKRGIRRVGSHLALGILPLSLADVPYGQKKSTCLAQPPGTHEYQSHAGFEQIYSTENPNFDNDADSGLNGLDTNGYNDEAEAGLAGLPPPSANCTITGVRMSVLP
jgi:hypothetical protein